VAKLAVSFARRPRSARILSAVVMASRPRRCGGTPTTTAAETAAFDSC